VLYAHVYLGGGLTPGWAGVTGSGSHRGQKCLLPSNNY